MSEEVRCLHSQPVLIHLLTNRGHISSPPIEVPGGVARIDHTFELKHTCFINGWVITHTDGVIFYEERNQMLSMTPGPFSVGVNIHGPDHTDCEVCKPT